MNFETNISPELESLNKIFRLLQSNAYRLSNDLKYDSDSYTIKTIGSRMELVEYKIDTVIEFINVLKTAEENNFDLGDRVKAAASYYYAELLNELEMDSDYDENIFRGAACLEFILNWNALCKRYKKYFTETIYLPNTLDTNINNFAEEIAEDIKY